MKRTFNLFVLVTLLALAFGAATIAPAQAAPAPAPRFAPPAFTLIGNCSNTYSMSYGGTNLGVQGVWLGSFSASGTEVCTLQLSPSIDSGNIILWWWASDPGLDTWSLDFNGSNVFNDPGFGVQMQNQAFEPGTSVTDVTITHPLGSGNGSIFTICVLGTGYYDFSTQNFAVGDGNCGGAPTDTTPPVVTVPSDITAEATSSSGAVVNFSVSATDETSPANPAVTCDWNSGDTFPLGTTPVTCEATDDALNTGYGSFNVTVEDTTPPSLTVPANITTEATSAAGATVNFIATASDLVDASPTVVCAPASGSTFAIGTTPVNCSATDDYSNTSNDSFTVTVEDTTAPSLNLPADITVPQNIPAGAVVNFVATATDLVDASPTVVCVPPSGSTFPVGTTTVNCSATDDYSNTANGSFNVNVFAWTAGTFTSVGGYDGSLLELNETSGTGGTGNAFAGTLNIGDSLFKQQQLGLLHFDTSSLPDTAVILGISIQMKWQSTTGINPFTTHGSLLVDIASPFFGALVNLQTPDFQAVSSISGVGAFSPVPLAGNWYNADLGDSAFPFLNLSGPTQFRMGFSLDDNNNSVADLLKFYSGNATVAAYRPVLIVHYYVP